MAASNDHSGVNMNGNGNNAGQDSVNGSISGGTKRPLSEGTEGTTNFKQMNAKIASLQEQVDTLFANINGLRNHDISTSVISSDQTHFRRPSISASQASITVGSPSQNRPRVPRFQGPTSTAYSFDVANSSLQTMGIHPGLGGPVDEGPTTKDSTPAGSLSPPAHPTKDPLWLLSKEEAIRLARVYEEEMGITYPILDIEETIRHASALYSFIGAATRSGLARVDQPGADGLGDDDTNILKMVIASALMTEGSGQSSLGARLFESVKMSAERRLWSPQVDRKGLVLLVLISIYHFHQDEEALAWRIIGLAARMCLDLGIHRRETLLRNFEGEEEQSQAIKLFWSIYVLDRRWSFGTGMPFALQDSDMDPTLPEPDASTPYLKVMVAYSRIGSKVWKSVAGFDNATDDVNTNDIGYIDYQILQWQKMIPNELQLLHPENNADEDESRSIRRLRVLLYLRANQMRILIYRPVLHSTTSIMENLHHAQNVLNLAKNSIRVLTSLNQTTDIYRKQQVCFNYFLVSALAVLFLAVSHAPAQFSSLCRDEFYMALDLVKGFSTRSYASRRLWRTIRGLKEVGPKLGLGSHHSSGTLSGDDAHSSAAVAMAGLAAGHPVDTPTEMAMFHAAATATGVDPHPGGGPSGFQMSFELTNLFEAAGGYGSVMGGGTSGDVNGYSSSSSGGMQGQSGGGGQTGNDTIPVLFGGDEELSRIMRDLF
ncbi:hypothetical protein FGG08_006920 [Glutinoglossum americanum]|uniref:Xylanolytic transcriptional activator regulatory domain-containing protein n=1 Tax=Glutinoglossum americanum TaxID=1670608 RepID=A0A9P8KUG9_9PEZI|nr:hypothetical protein FGG08_006920 [Glutinoglossum americanum]